MCVPARDGAFQHFNLLCLSVVTTADNFEVSCLCECLELLGSRGYGLFTESQYKGYFCVKTFAVADTELISCSIPAAVAPQK